MAADHLKTTLEAMKDLALRESGKSIEAEVREKLEEFTRLERLEDAEDLCIGLLLKEMQATYKKDPIRKIVIEPFLLILGAHNCWNARSRCPTSPKRCSTGSGSRRSIAPPIPASEPFCAKPGENPTQSEMDIRKGKKTD